MKTKNIAVLGSTGSIGTQTLEIADMLMPYAMRVKIVTDIFGLQRAIYADTF